MAADEGPSGPGSRFAAVDTASLLLALVEATGDVALLREFGGFIRGPTREQAVFPPDVAHRIRVAFEEQVARQPSAPEEPSRLAGAQDLRHELFGAALGRAVSEDEQQLLLREMGVSPELHVDWRGGRPPSADAFSVAIIGAGLSGIAMAMRLRRLQVPFVVFDPNPSVGGTWWVNDYPGCAVDIASHCYSYAFAQSAAWKRYFAPQPEILAYLRDCTARFGLHEHLRLGTTVTAVHFDESSRCWQIETRDADGSAGRTSANLVVCAVGQLGVPDVPAFEGLERFEGAVLHSARWNRSVGLRGRRVILVGGGASANQIGPAIVDEVAHLTVVQRSPHWMMDVPRYLATVPEGERAVLAKFPAVARWFRARTVASMTDPQRAAVEIDPAWDGRDGTISAANAAVRESLIAYIERMLGDRPALRDAVVPRQPPFARRMLRDNGWYTMLRREHVTLVPHGVARFVRDGLVDTAGTTHAGDLVVLATGFRAARMLATLDVSGRGGRTIRDTWGDDDPRAFLGIAVPDFPNFFTLYGPNTNIGTGGSIFFIAECQSAYVAQVVREMLERGLASVEVTRQAYDAYNAHLDARLATMVWAHPAAESWYRNASGRVITNMPWTSLEYWRMTRSPRLDDFTAQG